MLPFSTVILVNDLQYAKALIPIVVTPFGMVILDNTSQDWNALSPILNTLLGIVILVNPPGISPNVSILVGKTIVLT